MYMDEGLDTGDILLTRSLTLAPDETGGSLHDKLAALAPAALREALELLTTGHAPRTPQDHTRATYAPKLGRDDGLIDWTLPCDAIERRIRAFSPWPGACTFLPTGEGVRKLKIFACAVLPDERGDAGRVIAPEHDGLVVACGRGAVRLSEIQLEGRKRLTAAEFLRGHPVATGTALGGK
jgi:methionyl-tRNA formyltransferase